MFIYSRNLIQNIFRKLFKCFCFFACGLLFVLSNQFTISCKRNNISPSTLKSINWSSNSLELSRDPYNLKLMLESYSPVNRFDSNTQFNFFAAKSDDNDTRFSAYFIDYLNGESKNIIPYEYNLKYNIYRSRENPSIAKVDIFMLFQKIPPSAENLNFPYPNTIYFGSALFRDHDSSISSIEINQALDIHLSFIHSEAGFIGNAMIGIHLNELPYTYQQSDIPNLDTNCDGSGNCNTLSFKKYCSNNILKEECKPQPLNSKESNEFRINGRFENVRELEEGAFLLESSPNNNENGAILTFVSNELSSTPEENPEKCEDYINFFQTNGWNGEINPACTIKKILSSEIIDNKLTCKISVKFISPSDIGDFSCNIKAIFLAEKKEIQEVQLLYQP